MNTHDLRARRRRWRRQLRESLRPWPGPPRAAFACAPAGSEGCIEAAMSYLKGRNDGLTAEPGLRRMEVT